LEEDFAETFEITYPKRGDKLMPHSPGEKTLFADWMTGQWHWYPDAYKQAADKLVDQVEGHSWEDILIFPIVFLYRHFVELKLKELIIELDSLSGTQIGDNEFKKHNLVPLWQYVKAHLACITNGQWDNDILAGLDDLIQELSQLDPTSFHFRYSHDTEFQPITLPHQISMTDFKEGINKIANGFGYIDGGIEMEREGRSQEADFNAHLY